MPHLREEVVVQWPAGRVPTYLEWYLDRLAPTSGNRATLDLKVPGDVLGLPGGVSIGREVIATFAPVGDELNREAQILSMRWAPKDGGPFPSFTGVLKLTAATRGRCLLLLDGDYEPPLGEVGELFDAAIGRKIAHATARNLLQRIKAEMEASER